MKGAFRSFNPDPPMVFGWRAVLLTSAVGRGTTDNIGGSRLNVLNAPFMAPGCGGGGLGEPGERSWPPHWRPATQRVVLPPFVVVAPRYVAYIHYRQSARGDPGDRRS